MTIWLSLLGSERFLLELRAREVVVLLRSSDFHKHRAVGGSRSTDEVIVRLPLESDAHNRDDVLAKIFTDIDLARSEGDFCTLSNIGLEMPSLEAAFVRLLRAAENQPSGGNEDLQSTQQDASLPDEHEDDQEPEHCSVELGERSSLHCGRKKSSV